MPEQINQTSLVLLHYSITSTDGSIIETCFDDEPIELNMSDPSLPEGMMLALIGLKPGDEQTLTLTAEQCFGFRDEENIHDMPLTGFTGDLKPETGLTFNFGTPDGEDLLGTIRSIKPDSVEVDFNHPLAGLPLIFSVKIVDVNNSHAYLPND
ncbi:MAG: FKBP-type peptidyl-prolyl cis-trans isomerase [Gammaproteobacteria bacterium]|nr:FKBP-type peptidyl-prolyl cis-trans isomerase [Gammaproteobacteria bacterium]MCW8923542.1 FKBP-type peptidyl-prolyl cis-trans isomerase [Gammaproteobacteria bacterium]